MCVCVCVPSFLLLLNKLMNIKYKNHHYNLVDFKTGWCLDFASTPHSTCSIVLHQELIRKKGLSAALPFYYKLNL